MNISAQFRLEHDIIELPMGNTPVEDLLNPSPEDDQYLGYALPSVMTNTQYIRAMIVFVQFSDDSYVNPEINWPLNKTPTAWMGTNIIDPSIYTNSTNYNLTHYYKTMSMNNFKIIGDCYSVVTPNTRQQYVNMGYKYWDINRQIIELLDEYVEFDEYDKWNKIGAYSQEWGIDGEVDMIIMIYRNIEKDYPNTYANSLYFPFDGEASLGGSEIIMVDEGNKRVDMRNLNGEGVSGITTACGNNGLNFVKNVIIHELGHHLFGGMEYHQKVGGWGMMGTHGCRSQVINAFERHRLGWITVKQYDYNPTFNITLNDFITTGDALRIKIPGSNNPTQYYYLENHQKISPLDFIDPTQVGQGVYLMHQFYPVGMTLSFYNSKGRFNWSIIDSIMHPSGKKVKVYKKGNENINGFFESDLITTTELNISSMIEAYKDTVNNLNILYPVFWGMGAEMLNVGYVEVLNPYSNPPLNNVAIQVISENNQLKIKQCVTASTLLNTAPSRPQNFGVRVQNLYPNLIWKANTEPDVIGNSTKRGKYKIYRGYSTNGVLPTNFNYVGYVNHPITTFTDYDWFTPGIGNAKVFYRISAVDTTNLESCKTEFDSVQYNPALLKENQFSQPERFELFDNYPNPFNPCTTIEFALAENANVELSVFNMLGEKISELINGYRSSGKYSVDFNGADIPSGIYIYRLKTDNILLTKKMVLIK